MKLHATGRDLLIKESERLISGSIKIYECEFTFDESWDGYTVTAVFSTNGSRLINMAVVDGKCEIPSEVLRPNARIRIGVFGIDGDRRRPTTYSDWITVEQGVDLGGGSAQPPTPSVYEQWLRGLDEKQDEWNANEEARAEAEAARVEAENARVEAEEAREDQETGYVAQAESWAKEAEDQAKDAKAWADKAQEVVGGDYATKAQAQAYANTAESNANTYTDEQIAAIPTPDVSGQIGTHNTNETAHADIRQAISEVASNTYSKAKTLADDTKALFGLGSGAVPNDVFSKIGVSWFLENAVYRWTEEVYSPVPSATTTTVTDKNTTSSTTISVVYSDEIEMDDNLNPIMKNPVTLSRTFGSNCGTVAAEINAELEGKYIKYSESETDVYLFAAANYTTVQRYRVYITGYAITMTPTSKTVSSNNPDAYPSGVVGFYRYIKLAPEFEGMGRYQTGSYFGTGTVSSSSPNTLTFDFVPKFVVVGSHTAPYYGSSYYVQTGGAALVMVYGVSEALVSAAGSHYSVNKITWSEKSVSWYCTAQGWQGGSSSGRDSGQMNYSGVEYFYIAIG